MVSTGRLHLCVCKRAIQTQSIPLSVSSGALAFRFDVDRACAAFVEPISPIQRPAATPNARHTWDIVFEQIVDLD